MTAPASPPDLEALERLMEEATQGPWEWRDSQGLYAVPGPVVEGSDPPRRYPYGKSVLFGTWEYDSGADIEATDADRALIAAAVNALPALIAAARELQRLQEDDYDTRERMKLEISLVAERQRSAQETREACIRVERDLRAEYDQLLKQAEQERDQMAQALGVLVSELRHRATVAERWPRASEDDQKALRQIMRDIAAQAEKRSTQPPLYLTGKELRQHAEQAEQREARLRAALDRLLSLAAWKLDRGAWESDEEVQAVCEQAQAALKEAGA